MNSVHNKVALLVHSCDRYEFLYKGFEIFFSKHWDFDTNCNYYFATEEKDAIVNNFANIKSGKGEWADRLRLLLQEKIKEEYVLYFQEDMWLTKNTDAAFFDELFTLTIKNNWQQVKLHSSEVYTTIATGEFIDGFAVTKLDNEKSDYLMSHQVSLWNKQFLIQQLKAKEHPWRNERKGTKRLKKIDPLIIHIDYFAENGNAPINKNKSLDKRSEYKTISFNGALNHNIVQYIDELKRNENTEHESYALQLEHNFQHGLTHDGKSRPKKVDIFKRIKNWVQGK